MSQEPCRYDQQLLLCLEMLFSFVKLCEKKQNMEKIHLKILMPYLKYLFICSAVVSCKFMVLNGGADNAVQDEMFFIVRMEKTGKILISEHHVISPPEYTCILPKSTICRNTPFRTSEVLLHLEVF